MTKNETFKRRIRERMATTGERYAAARRSLIDRSAASRRRAWISEPELSDEAIRENTGRGWDDWCDTIDAWPGRVDGHTAIATHVRDEIGVDPWWAQGVTVGYERITGLRLPYQRPDGTFTADKSRTVMVDADRLRELIFDDDDRDHLCGGEPTELRSKPTSKSIRILVGPGVAMVSLEPRTRGRTKVTVAHERLPDYADVAKWKFFWTEWLNALDEADGRLGS
ncbi:hypothetical protein BH24ACT5_BH24ACT5_19060 [soil metagenome]